MYMWGQALHEKFVFVVQVPHCVLHKNGKMICEAKSNEKTTYFRLPKVVALHGEINF